MLTSENRRRPIQRVDQLIPQREEGIRSLAAHVGELVLEDHPSQPDAVDRVHDALGQQNIDPGPAGGSSASRSTDASASVRATLAVRGCGSNPLIALSPLDARGEHGRDITRQGVDALGR